jgi:UDP-N-acetylglucosamine 4,6-dehydratase
MFEDKTLLTGGSGFLGRAIIRRAAAQGLSHNIIVYSRDEMKQWELKQRYPDVTCILGDVARDLDRLIAVCTGVDTVLHLAAVKFIPEAEHNVLETIEVNIEGSKKIALAAIAAGVKTVVGISTDKACAPANLYGMTKAVMERMYGEFARRSRNTAFATARYGNVIGSTGSVIPVFKKQIEQYGEIRITDPEMTRFWFSVDEAIDLIEWAWKNAHAFPGATFVSPCPAMKIWDIAGVVWDMNGGDRRVTVTGIRPGEKLHEALVNDQEAPRTAEYYNFSEEEEMLGLKGYIMYPATHTNVEGHLEQGYSSDHPIRWLSPNAMEQAIRDAETV